MIRTADNLTVDMVIVLRDNGLHQLEIDMTEYEVNLRAARKAYIDLVINSSMDRDECLEELLKTFDKDVAEEAVADVESDLEELN